jgi:hypothetical protein
LATKSSPSFPKPPTSSFESVRSQRAPSVSWDQQR